MNVFDDRQRERHRDLISRVFSADPNIIEGAVGYRLQLAADPVLFLAIAEWVTLERLCCPFLDFQLEFTPERLVLTLSGGHGVKDFLKEEFGFR